MENNSKNLNLFVPGAIIIAGALIAGAVLYSNGALELGSSNRASLGDADSDISEVPKSVENMAPITEDDHMRGNSDAPVKVVEFSDLECPFCQRFHGTMRQIIEEYNGKVAWVYRHFPLDSLHSKSRKEAEASECAAELGGNDAFWDYIDRLFEITPANNGFNLKELPDVAEYIGLDKDEFQECLDSARYADAVAEDLEDAANSGGRGTPYSIVVGPNGEKAVINGAQPYDVIKQGIDSILRGLE